MNDMLARYREQLKRLSGEFTAGQKVVVVLAIIAVIGGSLMFSKMGSASSNVVLYANLKPEDASAITQELTSTGVKYELADGGTTIMVPPEAAAQARLDLAAKDLPSSKNEGWSILDKQSMTTSEFRQRIDYQRALEGELSTTIEALDAVDSAIVRLVIPRNDVFAADEQKTSASVLVTTKPGQTLSTAQVNSIVNLTAGAVPGLDPANVTVTDASGALLAAPGMEASAVGADANSSATATFENQVASGINELLVPVFGPGKVKVKVSAQLDYSKKETVSETVQAPNPTVVTEESTQDETLTGAGVGTGGVLGPDGLPITSTGGNSSYENNKAQRSYAVGKVTETVKEAPGQVQKLSIAVVVDDGSGGSTDLAQVRDVVAAAAGVDAQRGDTVQVTRLPFDNSAARQAAEARKQADADQSKQDLMALLRTVFTWLVIGVVALLIWGSIRRARKAQLAALAGTDEPDEKPAPKAKPAPKDDPEPEPEPELTEEELEEQRLADAVQSSSDVLRQAPAGDLAAIMRSWAQEG